MNNLFLNFLGFLLIVFGILDGLKYHWLVQAIKKAGTAKGQSRKFINAALGKDIVMFAYLAFHPDWYLISMTFIGFIFTIELLIIVYMLYPYRKRGLHNFYRPSFLIYLFNSILPNRWRKRL